MGLWTSGHHHPPPSPPPMRYACFCFDKIIIHHILQINMNNSRGFAFGYRSAYLRFCLSDDDVWLYNDNIISYWKHTSPATPNKRITVANIIIHTSIIVICTTRHAGRLQLTIPSFCVCPPADHRTDGIRL